MLTHLNLPPLTDRATMLELLQQEEAGEGETAPTGINLEIQQIGRASCRERV